MAKNTCGHRRVDICQECNQPWPCETEREARQQVAPRCSHVVASSGKPCNNRVVIDPYCRSHYWAHELGNA
jgi:hypothetical protein